MSTRNIIALALAVIAFVFIMLWASNLAVAEPRDDCAIQRELKSQGFYDGAIDCQLGEQSADAIRAFQRANDLPQTGSVGPATSRALFGTRNRMPVADDDQPEDANDTEDRCARLVVKATEQKAWRSRAVKYAIRAWQAKVLADGRLGLRYSNWETAADKDTTDCNPLSATLVSCTVVARPCKRS